MPSTALLMADNRPPVLSQPRVSTLTYPALAFALNALYACAHGYDLLYYRMASAECQHATQGVRHASYCKLPAIAHALEKYNTVVFIDSDSFFLQRNVSVPELLQQYAPPAHATPSRPAVWLANDLPQLGERPNGGFHVWLGGGGGDSAASRVLRTWWHLPALKYAVEHDYEQHALQWSLGQLRAAVPLIGTLQLRAMADTFTHAVAHIDHTKAERRLWVMAVALLAAAHERPDEGAASAPRRHRRLQQLLQQASAIPPTVDPPAALRARALRAAADLLGDGFGAPARPAAIFSQDGVRCNRRAGGLAAAAQAPRLRAFEYNASVMSLRTLPAHDLLGADGLTLALLPCRGARGNSGGPAGGGGRENVLQEWRAVGSGAWQLVARPSFCIGVGPRKAPKTPYPPLAQLHNCAGVASGGSAGSGGPLALLRLQHESKRGRLEVRATMSAVRGALRDAAREMRQLHGREGRQLRQKRLRPSGEWPHKQRKHKHKKHKKHHQGREDADGTVAEAQLQPDPQHDAARRPAKGKGKAPFWQDGALKADQPPDARLCLSTWRGMLGVGSVPVFAPCAPAEDPPGEGSKEARAQRFALLDAPPEAAVAGEERRDAKLLQLGGAGADGGLCVSALSQGVAWQA